MCVWGGSDLVKQLLNTKGSKRRRRKKHKRRIERLELVNITRPKDIFPTMHSQLETHLQKAVLDGHTNSKKLFAFLRLLRRVKELMTLKYE